MKNSMNSQVQDIWHRFDDLIKNAETPEARMIGETAKLQAMLLNLRLVPIEHLLERMPSRG
jgi:chemotaxis protein histidine kinase CheA